MNWKESWMLFGLGCGNYELTKSNIVGKSSQRKCVIVNKGLLVLEKIGERRLFNVHLHKW